MLGLSTNVLVRLAGSIALLVMGEVSLTSSLFALEPVVS